MKKTISLHLHYTLIMLLLCSYPRKKTVFSAQENNVILTGKQCFPNEKKSFFVRNSRLHSHSYSIDEEDVAEELAKGDAE